MEPWEQFFMMKQVERTINALKKNNFDALYVPDRKAALDEVLKHIPDGAKVSVGGSLTLSQMGLFDALKNRKVTLIWPAQGKNPEEYRELLHKSFTVDVFLSGTNAVTEDGKLFNLDASGNRVAAMVIGPKKVIVVTGVNKIVKDVQEAEHRMKGWVAPQNAKRLNRKTPCAETGVCADCSSPDRICNIYVTLAKKPGRVEFSVILVGESMGI